MEEKDPIHIEGTDDTPNIRLDSRHNTFEISGTSNRADIGSFSNLILGWLDHYASNPNPSTQFTFRLDYFNSASSKMLLDILSRLENMYQAGNDVVVKWCYKAENQDMRTAGDEYAEMVEVPFENICIN
ncbi:MAG: DUF1987 domain-containing protein [Bacteroidetes bacterium]|nr:DUF1987 domain-containing protein [Bacteroidota bacterium]MBU1721063.1 DUF1987 domain-containing protein [Bacteroidota bacterium]